MADWDETSPSNTDIVSQFPANERAARGVVKSVFGAEHHEENDANQGKHEGLFLLDQAGNPTITGADVALYNNGGALRSGVAGTSYPVLSHVSTQIYTSSDTWTKPAGLKMVRVHVVGAGGGGLSVAGSGSGNGAGAGGASGGYSFAMVLTASLLASETVTVGAAGAVGTAGGNSAFGGHALASGGGSGSAAARSTSIQSGGSASGGAATAGDVNVSGTTGFRGLSFGSTADLAIGGVGASTPWGNGGRGAQDSNPANGVAAPTAGTGYGAGGGGGAYAGTQRAAAAGSAGIVIVEEYF